MAKTLITEQDVRAAASKGSKTLALPKGAIITPLAAEAALALGVSLAESVEIGRTPSEKDPAPAGGKQTETAASQKTIVFGSDHGGFQLKQELKKYAEGLGFNIVDVGTHSEQSCDYPDFAYAVAASVAKGEAWRGVMIDGAGIGSCVVANKVPGIRAACCHNEFVARNAREHNDTNVLTLGSRVVGNEVCKEILRVWLETWFAGGRHKQRVDKIADVESRFMK